MYSKSCNGKNLEWAATQIWEFEAEMAKYAKTRWGNLKGGGQEIMRVWKDNGNLYSKFERKMPARINRGYLWVWSRNPEGRKEGGVGRGWMKLKDRNHILALRSVLSEEGGFCPGMECAKL